MCIRDRVSYDPQATVHFVDPFHIVDYPRERTSFTELELRDERRIVDLLSEPRSWDNFFQRDVGAERRSALLVGKIYGSRGRLVRDSFRNDQWVFLRREDGSGEGVRILSTGEFALSPELLEEENYLRPLRFFYRDGQGALLEERLRVSPGELRREVYRLDHPAEAVAVVPGDGEQLYLWFPVAGGENWKLDQIRTGDDGAVRFFSRNGQWILSSDRQATATRYRLDMTKLSGGRNYGLDELPRYYSERGMYIRLYPPREERGEESGDLELRFVDLESGRRYVVRTVEERGMVFELPHRDFSTLVLEKPGLMVLAETSERLQAGEAVDFDVVAETEVFSLELDQGGATVVLVRRMGRKYAEILRGRSGAGGELKLYVDRQIAEEEELFLLFGTPLGSERVELSEVLGTR